MTNRATLFFADAPEEPAFAERASQRPALLAEMFPALWWFCCFAAEDVVSYEVDGSDGGGNPVRVGCLGCRTPVARALERIEERLLSSAELLEPDLFDARDRFIAVLRDQGGRWLHLDLSEIEPLCMPDSIGTESLEYHVRIVDTKDHAEALAYAEGHGLATQEGRISARNRIESLMGYEDCGPEDRTVSREYIPRCDPVVTPERAELPASAKEEPSGYLAKPVTLLGAVRVVALALVGFGLRERERIIALSKGAMAAMTDPSWANANGEFASDGRDRLLILPGLSETAWQELRRLLLRHTHELHAMTVSAGDARPMTAETPIRSADGATQRLSFGYDGIGFTADDLAAAPLQLRFDPAAIGSERHFISLISVACHLARKLKVDLSIANAGETDAPFLTCSAAGIMAYVPRT